MLFNSYVFMLLFLPLTLLSYFTLGRFGKYRAASVLLLLASLCFYGYFNIRYLPLIILSIAVNYTVYYLLLRTEKKNARVLLLCIGIAFDIGLLFYYKYFGFFVENLNALFSSDLPLTRLILPLGISFFTFQQVSFLVDTYKREVGSYGLLDYALFVSYFPQLIAGPIVTHDELIPQLSDNERKIARYEDLSSGIYLFSLGLAKKVLLADTLGGAVEYGFSRVTGLSAADAVIVMLSYALQIYFDFSGYCDMASGIAKMMNIDLPENFVSPYRAESIGAFWRGWHITLTRFLKKYIYLPLGGSRHGRIREYINVLVVFLVSGIWHGAAWTFVLWGALHGILMVLERCAERPLRLIPRPIRIVGTFLCVSLLWVSFRAESMSDALAFYGRLIDLDNLRASAPLLKCFMPSGSSALVSLLSGVISEYRLSYAFMLLSITLSLVIVFTQKRAREHADSFVPSAGALSICCALLLMCLYSLSGVSPFLYFNF